MKLIGKFALFALIALTLIACSRPPMTREKLRGLQVPVSRQVQPPIPFKPQPLPLQQPTKYVPPVQQVSQIQVPFYNPKKSLEKLKLDSSDWITPRKTGVIMLDPGHGGDDFGTHSSSRPRYQEKSLNLVTSNLVKTYLEQMGYKILMTRKDDVFITLDKRAEIANDQKTRIFVSIHYNSAPSKDAEGIEVFYYQADDDKHRTKESKLLAQSVLNGIIDQTQAKSRGVKHGNLAVIRQTKMPAILIEGGFLTNDGEMEKIKNPTYMKQIAWGIAKGIDEFLTKETLLKP